MKLNSIIKFLSILTICLSIGCSKKRVEKQSGESGVGSSSSFILEQGWDIYNGGGYRYGPSIMIDNDNTIHAWFAAPGGIHGLDQLHYSEAEENVAQPLSAQDVAAQKFSSAVDFYGIGVRCPSWNSKNSSLTLSIYEWKGDYSTSLSTTAILSTRFENYTDNQVLRLSKSEKFKSGTYIWTFSAAGGTAGVWSRKGTVAGVTTYLNGKELDRTLESFVMNNESKGTVYWDQVAYKKSTDNGKTWTQEQMVIKPTEGTRDEFSICDPAVVKIGKYYYLGYTSTEDERMIFNHVYVARSTSPSGPWEKWDGKTWGNNPQPVVVFNGDKDAWGAGEPSMVVKDDKLYFYYTWRDKDKHEIRIAIADANNENWPATLIQKGVALNQKNINEADHGDVKYRIDLDRFQLLHTASRLSPKSFLMLWESKDGISFQKVADIKDACEPYLHNCGWSGNALGHIDPKKPQFVAYGYGENWGNWKTKWQPIQFKKIDK